MVQNYENTTVPPPKEYRERPIPMPRKNVKQLTQKLGALLPKPIPMPHKVKPMPAPRNIIKTHKALKGFTESYKIKILTNMEALVDNDNTITGPLTQLTETRKNVSNLLKYRLASLRGLKHVEVLKITFMKEHKDDTFTFKTAFF